VDGDPGFVRAWHLDSGSAPAAPETSEGDEVWIGELCFSATGDQVPPVGAGGLLVFGQEPRPGDEDEFDAWIDTEHIPTLAGVTGTLTAQRYEALVGTPRFAAMYYLTEPAVCTSEEWRIASRTPWRARMSERNLNRRRGLYAPVQS